MLAFRGEKPLGFLSLSHTIFGLLLSPASHLNFSPLPHKIVFPNVTTNLPPKNYSWLLFVSKYLVISLLPYAPIVIREDPGIFFL